MLDPVPHATAPVRFARWAWGWTRSIVMALFVWFLLSSFVVQMFRITSGSMEPTVLVGEFLIVNRMLYGAEVPLTGRKLPAIREPRRDEIVVVQSPVEDLRLLKRLVGLPGDTLGMTNGRLTRNGEALVEPYARLLPGEPPIDPTYNAGMRGWHHAYLAGTDPATYDPDPRNWGPLVVPRDSMFLLGDNRDGSLDSRFWGFVPRSNLLGKPLLIYMSFDPTSHRPLPLLTAIRWRRLFTAPR